METNIKFNGKVPGINSLVVNYQQNVLQDWVIYIGKGSGNRVFEHEQENQKNTESEKLKLKTIVEIRAAGLEV